jgi:hypothetical protein
MNQAEFHRFAKAGLFERVGVLAVELEGTTYYSLFAVPDSAISSLFDSWHSCFLVGSMYKYRDKIRLIKSFDAVLSMLKEVGISEFTVYTDIRQAFNSDEVMLEEFMKHAYNTKRKASNQSRRRVSATQKK